MEIAASTIRKKERVIVAKKRFEDIYTEGKMAVTKIIRDNKQESYICFIMAVLLLG